MLTGSGNDLVDCTDVEAAEMLFAEITDPNTGEPIAIIPNQIFATPAKKHTINRIINATEVRYTDQVATETLSANPLTSYRSAISPWLTADWLPVA